MKSVKAIRVLLVNPQDEPIGEEEKLMAHRYAMLHRAFSVLVFREPSNKKDVLLQQRNLKKYHCGGLWSNTCCSHPGPEENDLQKTAQSRLLEEMGLAIPLEEKGVFHYVAAFDNGLYENEIDHVFIGFAKDVPIRINEEEVAAYRWVDVEFLQQDLIQNPKKYTPWLAQTLRIALD
ncbi:MAG: isopentenyl-diphosphate Delta-isomerase [Tatlockia sp.]|jgi:diphosphomevalonate decarboxylase